MNDKTKMHSKNWTEEEVATIKENIEGLAGDLDLLDDPDFQDELLRRTLDMRDYPEKMLTIDEFVEQCEEKGIYCSHCGGADSDCQFCIGTGDDYADLVPEDDEECTHANLNISVNGIYCEDCDKVFEDNTGSNLMGG